MDHKRQLNLSLPIKVRKVIKHRKLILRRARKLPKRARNNQKSRSASSENLSTKRISKENYRIHQKARIRRQAGHGRHATALQDLIQSSPKATQLLTSN